MPDGAPRVAGTQRDKARVLLAFGGMVRSAEFRQAGVTAATLSRMERSGEVIRLARGLYQLADAPLDINHSLAEAARRVPKGIVCLVSALSFHGLTDQHPKAVWLAIGRKDWAPDGAAAPLRLVRFAPDLLSTGVETHLVGSVPVKVFGIAETLADCFRHRRRVGLAVVIEALGEALRRRMVTPSEVAAVAARRGAGTIVRPYLEAMTIHG